MPEKDYDADYYTGRFRPALSSAEAMVPFLIKYASPNSVVDIGSAEGAWLSVFKKHGVKKIRGFDGPWAMKENLLIPLERFTSLDLETFNAPINQRYDLAMSLEVAEHLAEKAADNFVYQLTRLSDRVLFSAAIPGQGGLHHVNEQPPNYWAKKFATRGFIQSDILRPHFWNDKRIAWWYRQNVFLYENSECRSNSKETSTKDSFKGAYLVHPDAFNEKARELDIENASASNLLKALRSKIGNKFLKI
jgi:hypothetical protein